MPTATTESYVPQTWDDIPDQTPFDESEEWQEILEELGDKIDEVEEVVKFTSYFADHVTEEHKTTIEDVDINAWDEAKATEKLAYYKRGKRIGKKAVNSCGWYDEETARRATHMPKHMIAFRYVIDRGLYENFFIERYKPYRDDIGTRRLELVGRKTKADIDAHYNDHA